MKRWFFPELNNFTGFIINYYFFIINNLKNIFEKKTIMYRSSDNLNSDWNDYIFCFLLFSQCFTGVSARIFRWQNLKISNKLVNSGLFRRFNGRFWFERNTGCNFHHFYHFVIFQVFGVLEQYLKNNFPIMILAIIVHVSETLLACNQVIFHSIPPN